MIVLHRDPFLLQVSQQRRLYRAASNRWTTYQKPEGIQDDVELMSSVGTPVLLECAQLLEHC